MPSRARATGLLSCVVFALAGCKESSSANRPLPAPEPPATATQTPPREEAPAKKRPVVDEDDKPAPKRPSEAEEPAKAPAPSTTEPAAQAGTASGGAPQVPPAASVPPVTAPNAACLQRCQSAMQGCLSQPVDGGVPGFGNIELCKNAFAACQAACK